MSHDRTAVDVQRKIGQTDYDVPAAVQQQSPRRLHQLSVRDRRLHQATLDHLNAPPGSR
jgi:hypothetical protein